MLGKSKQHTFTVTINYDEQVNKNEALALMRSALSGKYLRPGSAILRVGGIKPIRLPKSIFDVEGF